jgi:molybdopterin adenylyltransferase
MAGVKVRIGIVTVSDRAARGEYEDRGGPAIEQFLRRILKSTWEPVCRIVPDEQDQIEQTLKQLCDEENCCLVLTTGGTGPAPRDVTPEATEAVAVKLLPGFGERMRAVAADNIPTAILARQAAAVRGKSLIINLPGSPKAIEECLTAVFPAIPHCIETIEGPKLETNPEVLKSSQPDHE